MNESITSVIQESGDWVTAQPNHELITDRLLLRHFKGSDFETYAAMVNRHDVMRYIGDGQPLSRVDAWKNMAMTIGHWVLRGFGLWAVEEKQSGVLIGRIGLYHPEGWPGLEVGWMLDRPYWGKGFATEGSKAAVNFAFQTLHQEKLISLLHPENKRSVGVAKRIGQTHERTLMVGQSTVLVYGIDRLTYLKNHNLS